jgi:hypothetical protein
MRRKARTRSKAESRQVSLASNHVKVIGAPREGMLPERGRWPKSLFIGSAEQTGREFVVAADIRETLLAALEKKSQFCVIQAEQL